jgi:hypothetical protein
MLKFGKKVTF